MMINHKETRMVEDGKDKYGLQTMKLKKFRLKFSRRPGKTGNVWFVWFPNIFPFRHLV